MKRYKYKILTGTTGTTEYQLPIYLEASVDEMGIMVGFDGDIEQAEQFCNFIYEEGIVPNSLIIYNALNTNRIKAFVDSIFTVSWGDGNSEEIKMPTVYDENLPFASHLYTSGSTYNVEITVNSPWKIEKLKREIIMPFSITGITYLDDLTGVTSGTTISFLALGKSRIDEMQMYGRSYNYSGLTITATYTGYTIDELFYMDYPDGYTHITGNTSLYYTDEVYQGMITRNEHLIGFMDLPQISSDIFIERGKQGVMERNLRLGEIDNIGELGIYGSGYFNVQKQ